MPDFRSLSKTLIPLLALAGAIYFYYGFATVETRINEVCRQIQPGMTLTELATFADHHGLGPTPNEESGVNYLVEGRTFGRFGCKVTLESGAVKSSEFHFAD